MPFRVDILENGEFVKREDFDNHEEAKSYRDLWNGYQRTPGAPWIAILITGIKVFRELEEETQDLLIKLNRSTLGNDPTSR